MAFGQATDEDRAFMARALAEARAGFDEGGVPVGAVIAEAGEIVAAGRNRRIQDGNPIAHGEIDCLRRAGRRPDYRAVTLYTTLSPCMMCAGAIVQFDIPRVVVGERRNFEGNLDFLSDRGVEVVLLDDPGCAELMARFIREQPTLWNEDIAKQS